MPQTIAIDGKTLRRSGQSTTGKEALHLVSDSTHPVVALVRKWCPSASANCRSPPAEGCWNDVPNEIGAEVDKDGTEHEARESGEKNRQPQVEDPHFLELVELQRRMFQST